MYWFFLSFILFNIKMYVFVILLCGEFWSIKLEVG